MSPVKYFVLKADKIELVLSVQAQMVFKFLACLVQEKINMKFLLASLKTLTDSETCSESRIKFLFRLSLHSRLSEQFSGSQFGYGTTFRDTDGYQKAGTNSLKRVTGRNFTISK
jgi:hypothetical protein